MVSHFLRSQPVGGGGFRSGRRVWDVYSREGPRQGTNRLGWFPIAGRFFQCRGGELGKGNDSEGCRLVTTVDGSCLGVVGHDASRVGRAIAVAMGRREGLQFTTMIFILYPPKQSHFDAILKNK